METFELDGRSIENPVFCAHRRAKNRTAIMVGKNAANAQRTFLPTHGRIVDLSKVMPGDLLEFAGDSISASGIRRSNRTWWLVRDINDNEMTVDVFETLASAMGDARQAAAKVSSNG
jgi:hypothetical protein